MAYTRRISDGGLIHQTTGWGVWCNGSYTEGSFTADGPVEIEYYASYSGVGQSTHRFTTLSPQEGKHVVYVLSFWGSAAYPYEPFDLESVEEIDCETGCSKCIEGNCESGQVDAKLGSLKVNLGLGQGSYGQTSGHLSIFAERPSLRMASPDGLVCRVPDGAEYIRTNGTPRQIRSPSGLADVVTVNPFQYEVRYYNKEQIGAKVNGLYQVSGDPYTVVRVDNPDASTDVYNRLRIIRDSGGIASTNEYSWLEADQAWSLMTGNGLRQETRSTSWDGAEFNRVDTIVVRGEDGDAVSKVEERWEDFGGRSNLVSRVVDPDGKALETRWFYTALSTNMARSRMVSSMVEPSGRWTRYEYDGKGRTSKYVEVFGNSPTNALENASRVTTVIHTNVAPQVTRITALLGHEIARQYEIQDTANGVIQKIICQRPGAGVDAADNLVTVEKRLKDGTFRHELESVSYPDGTKSLFSYQLGANGGTRTTIKSTGVPNQYGTAVIKGIREVTVVDAAGHTMTNQTYDIESGLLVAQRVTAETDALGRPKMTVDLGGTNTASYACCGLESSTDYEGITTSYLYDDLKRVIATVRAGITAETDYDAEGRVKATYRNGVKMSAYEYNLAGQLISFTDVLGHTTLYAEERNGAGETVRTTVYPNQTTRVETFFVDGSLKSVTGTAVHGVRYEYGVEEDGGVFRRYTREIKLTAAGADSGEWNRTYFDMLDRPYKTLHADGSYAQDYFNAVGRLWKRRNEDGIVTLYAYNDLSELEIVAIDMDRDDVIDYDGLDRIAKKTTSVVADNGVVKHRTSTMVWPDENVDAAELISMEDVAADGLHSWHTSWGLTNSASIRYDRSMGRRTVTTTSAYGTVEVGEFKGGRIETLTRRDAEGHQLMATGYEYDTHGRLKGKTDARTGTTTYTYFDDDRVHTVTTPPPDDGSPAQVAVFGYDEMGRQDVVTLPDGGMVDYDYHDTGELRKMSGARTYPVEYAYDYAGRLESMTTWKDHAGNTGTAITRWHYNPLRGWLDNKQYDDGKGPDYDYWLSGLIRKRTWARTVNGQPLSAEYAYTAAGELDTINYSDATPDVDFDYDRLGQLKQVRDGIGTQTLGYNDPGQLTDHNYVSGPLSGIGVSNGHDTLFRRTNLGVQLPGQGTVYAVSYGYDAASRLKTVADDHNHMATYTYVPNSSLVTNIVFEANGVPTMTTFKSYDHMDRLRDIRTLNSDLGTLAAHTYEYNAANQRNKVTLADGSYWEYTYDDLGQVTSGRKYWPGGSPIPGQQFGYEFDNIGNRKTTTTNGRESVYASNPLNQYESRTVPGAVDVIGAADMEATVTVNNQSVSRSGEYFHKALGVDNTLDAVYKELNIVGVRKNAGPNQEDVVTEITSHAFVPKTPEVFQYDDDGNLIQDGRWTYTWDAENRLVAIESTATVPVANRKRLEFAYDYMSRRISKKVYTWDVGSSVYSLQSSVVFVYNGRNLLCELSVVGGQCSVVSSYTWGLDLSGSEQGAGGVGGLLFTTVHSPQLTVYAAAFDGNGNVIALVDVASGNVAAEYEYDPFGNAIRAAGPAAQSNPMRFSTKYQDAETGLYDFGYRFYQPTTGRWLNRDPIEELGGIGLYAFVCNDAANGIDPIGLEGLNGVGNIIRAINQVTVPIRGSAGLVGSILTGDIFSRDSPDPQYDENQCAFLITVTGINMKSRVAQEAFMKDIAALQEFKWIKNPAWVNNPSRFWGKGDLVQIFINETLYLVTIPDLRTVRKINSAAEKAKSNGCECWCITIVAHSQGTEVVKRALDLVSPKTKKHISVIGLGGETTFGPGDGVMYTLNIAHVNDPVPRKLNKISFWNGKDNGIVYGNPDADNAFINDPPYMNLRGFYSHSWHDSYIPYMKDNPIYVPRCNSSK